jgi:hypothetical protein
VPRRTPGEWARFLLPATPDTKEDTIRLGQQLSSYGPSAYGNGWDTLPNAERRTRNAELRSASWCQARQFRVPHSDFRLRECRSSTASSPWPCRSAGAERGTRNGALLPAVKLGVKLRPEWWKITLGDIRVPRSDFRLR